MGKTADRVQYTIDKEIGHIRSAYNRAAKDGLIPQSIIPVFNIEKKNATIGARHGTINDDQYATLMEKLPAHVSPILAFCEWTGVRKKEATFVHRCEANWEKGVVCIRPEESKKFKQRIVGIPQVIFPILWAWEQQTRNGPHRKADYLFHFDGERITVGQIDHAFNKTCEELGWHKPRVDEDGKIVKGKNGDTLYGRSPQWHDSRRAATTTVAARRISSSTIRLLSRSIP
jgi:integrase